ncbi:MAG: GNAT family N-acetyltransferase [Candidatus Heimdallarchaeaceae archaeon]
MIKFVKLNVTKHLPILLELNIAYFEWIAEEGEKYLNISFESILGSPHSYAAMILDELEIYQPPGGVFYLLKEKDDFIGMCALKKLYRDTGEVKRMFIKSDYRGKGYGKKMIERLIKKSQALGYKALRLDSGPFMKAAQKIYRSYGFEEIDEYPEAEVPKELRHDWSFLEKKL